MLKKLQLLYYIPTSHMTLNDSGPIHPLITQIWTDQQKKNHTENQNKDFQIYCVLNFLCQVSSAHQYIFTCQIALLMLPRLFGGYKHTDLFNTNWLMGSSFLT